MATYILCKQLDSFDVNKYQNMQYQDYRVSIMQWSLYNKNCFVCFFYGRLKYKFRDRPLTAVFTVLCACVMIENYQLSKWIFMWLARDFERISTYNFFFWIFVFLKVFIFIWKTKKKNQTIYPLKNLFVVNK